LEIKSRNLGLLKQQQQQQQQQQTNSSVKNNQNANDLAWCLLVFLCSGNCLHHSSSIM
jgi:sulfatase maturation enzyme AslB (radical SAM superfamily)